MRALAVLLLALVLAACQPAAPAPATNLQPVLDAITALDERVTVLTAHTEATNDRIVQTENSLRAQLVALAGTASDLAARPLTLADVDLASIEVLLVTTSPDVLDFLTIQPGSCADDLPLPRNAIRPGETIVTIPWPAPTGPHCITYEGEDATFGTVVHVPAGAIGGVTMLPPTE